LFYARNFGAWPTSYAYMQEHVLIGSLSKQTTFITDNLHNGSVKIVVCFERIPFCSYCEETYGCSEPDNGCSKQKRSVSRPFPNLLLSRHLNLFQDATTFVTCKRFLAWGITTGLVDQILGWLTR